MISCLHNLLFCLIFFFFLLVKNHLLVTSGVIICTDYTSFANTLNIQSKNKYLVKVNGLAVCLFGVTINRAK